MKRRRIKTRPLEDIRRELEGSSKTDLKDFKDKIPLTEIQWKAIANDKGLLGVFKFARKKYGNISSWRNKDKGSIKKYKDALLRHVFRVLDGEDYDVESKLPHMSHISWCALTILEFMIEEGK